MNDNYCFGCGSPAVKFINELFDFEHKGTRVDVTGLSGWRCENCRDVEFDKRSALIYATAGDRLVLNGRD